MERFGDPLFAFTLPSPHTRSVSPKVFTKHSCARCHLTRNTKKCSLFSRPETHILRPSLTPISTIASMRPRRAQPPAILLLLRGRAVAGVGGGDDLSVTQLPSRNTHILMIVSLKLLFGSAHILVILSPLCPQQRPCGHDAQSHQQCCCCCEVGVTSGVGGGDAHEDRTPLVALRVDSDADGASTAWSADDEEDVRDNCQVSRLKGVGRACV